MVSVKVASVAGAVALFATAANAADMPALPPVYMPPIEEFVRSGWYLRGDIGMTNQQCQGPASTRSTTRRARRSKRSAWAGTARCCSASASATNSTTGCAPTSPANIAARRTSTAPTASASPAARRASTNYSRQQVRVAVPRQRLCRSRHLVVLHAVSSAPASACAQHQISGFRDDGINYVRPRGVALRRRRHRNGISPGPLHAGITYKVTQSMSIDFGYRYIDLGNAHDRRDAGLRRQLHATAGRSPSSNITSHDLKLGVRWMLERAGRRRSR